MTQRFSVTFVREFPTAMLRVSLFDKPSSTLPLQPQQQEGRNGTTGSAESFHTSPFPLDTCIGSLLVASQSSYPL